MPMGKQKINIYSLKDYTHLCLCIKKQYKIYVVICLIFFIITFFFFSRDNYRTVSIVHIKTIWNASWHFNSTVIVWKLTGFKSLGNIGHTLFLSHSQMVLGKSSINIYAKRTLFNSTAVRPWSWSLLWDDNTLWAPLQVLQ